MSSDDDVPAPSPWAAVLARRASREAKSMREESGSEEHSDDPVEWEDDDEVSSEEDGSEVFIPIRLRNQKWDKYHFSGTQLWQRRAKPKGREFIMPPLLVVLASTNTCPRGSAP